MQYSKPYLSLPQQLDLLKKRGLLVRDDAAATECLHRNGYYRLSAYWYPFRQIVAGQRTDQFLPNSYFEDASALYVFDKKFKLLLLDALERIEIAARVEMALLLGAHDPFALSNRSLFYPSFVNDVDVEGKTKFDKWTEKYESAVKRSRDEFVFHHENKYGARLPLPIWIAIELWDFGLLSHLYGGLLPDDCRGIATRFNVPDWQLMGSWLRVLNYVRNVIAHHSRLWNLNLSDNPKLPKRGTMLHLDHLRTLPNASTRIYSVCCILCHFSRIINPQSSWPRQLKDFINAFPQMPYASIQNMGFPESWQDESLWQ